LELLKDPAPEIRTAAAKELGSKGNSPALAALRERVVDQTEQAAVRGAAIDALGKIGDTSGRELILVASRDSDPHVREEALRVLVGVSMGSAADRLDLATRAAEDGELSLSFRAEAIRVLTSTRDASVVPTLAKILETGPRIKIEPPPGATEQQVLAGRYQQIGNARAWAAQGLGELGDRSVLPKLITATEDADDFFLRYVAAGALVSWCAREALPAFLRLLDDPAYEVRTVAVMGVGAVGDTSNCERLQAVYLREGHPQVREALKTALANLKCTVVPLRDRSTARA
jgi:HEAT repeat protein